MSAKLDPKSFPAWVAKLDKSGLPLPKVMIALDPGETTGLAVFNEANLVEAKQLATHSIYSGTDILIEVLDKYKPDMVVFEDYRIYDFKAQSHSWGTLHTPRLIGALQSLCHQRGIKTFYQLAQQPKLFCTDQKLEQWGYYRKGLRHARDAIRHGCYYLIWKNGQFHDQNNLSL